MTNLRIVLTPEQRPAYLADFYEREGFNNVKEDPMGSYCPISLTSTPPELKGVVQARQDLTKGLLLSSGISTFDPAIEDLSPDRDKTSSPGTVFDVDCTKIANNRYFAGHNLLPSTGVGVEQLFARFTNRIGVTFMDANFSASRMQPTRLIYLQYNNFIEQLPQFIPVFQFLQEYNPGMGFVGKLPVLAGFPKKGGNPIDLEEAVYREFRDLQYHFKHELPIVKLRVENPEVFYELRPRLLSI